MKKWLKIIIPTVLILTISLVFSSYNAKKVASSFVNPAQNQLIFDNISFVPYLSFGEAEPSESYMSIWRVSYCPKGLFCCFPVEIYVSMLGNIKLTNPRNLKERIEINT